MIIQRNSYRPRRGMALLFVVSLILFITLLGTSFVVVSQQFASSSKARARMLDRNRSGNALIYRAFYELIRGPNPNLIDSPLRGQSILADMYGHRGFRANDVSVTASASVPGAWEVQFFATQTLYDSSTVSNVSSTADIYNGQVLTFVDGQAKGVSGRIIDYHFTGALGVFTVLPFNTHLASSTPSLSATDDIVVNGRAFSGAGGGGFDPTATPTTPQLENDALFPNHAGETLLSLLNYLDSGPHESYDAIDYQNMYMAAMDWGEDGDPTTAGDNHIHASFDRPELYDYVTANFAGNEGRATFRAFGEPGNELQVDTDGDGVKDSIWIDIGLPIQTDPNGRRYRPLVAYRVLDMDGKFNLNAHGFFFDIDTTNSTVNPADGLPQREVNSVDSLGTIDLNLSNEAAVGQGYGPPEVSMTPLFWRWADAPADPDGEYISVMAGGPVTDPLTSATSSEPGRYGSNSLPGGLAVDAWTQYRLQGYPSAVVAAGGLSYVGNYFGSPLDLFGRYSVAVPDLNGDPGALPSFHGSAPLGTVQLQNSAYEITLFPQASINSDASDDQPFTPRELERLLRLHDRDANTLPNRLALLTPNTLFGSSVDINRYAVTTDSWHVPSLSPIQQTLNPFGLFFDSSLYAPEIAMGMPMNINRPFGNGVDDDGNGTYDEAEEASFESVNFPAATGTAAVAFDHGEGHGTLEPGTAFARQKFAKQLYTLALTAIGLVDNPGVDAGQLAARRKVAQWVANVIDFRDSDAIMTPFEYDPYPFDGWDVNADGVIDGFTPLVWGVERPELLISETFASHARMIQDLDLNSLDGVGDDGQVSGSAPDDDDFDSKFVPQPSVFFELYHPWTQDDNNQLIPAELCEFDASDSRLEIDLIKKASSTDPIWRIVVLRGAAKTSDPYIDTIAEADVARRIYFTNPDVGNTASDNIGSGQAYRGNKVFFPSTSNVAPTIDRGGYAIVGTGGVTSDTDVGPQSATFFGKQTGADWTAGGAMNNLLAGQTRRIELTPTSFSVYDPDTSTLNPRPGIPVIAVDLNSESGLKRRLGISDPDDGYYSSLTSVSSTGVGLMFVTGQDEPADFNTTSPHDHTDTAIQNAVLTDGTTEDVCVAHLQRLANPLQGFDPVNNPYLTVDAASIDLVAFNGIEDDVAQHTNINAGDVLFATRERGRHEDPAYQGGYPALPTLVQRRKLWPYEAPSGSGTFVADVVGTNPQFGTSTSTVNVHEFHYDLHETLGFLNDTYVHSAFTTYGEPMAFPWLRWANRPFISHLELMEVPHGNSFELLRNFSVDEQIVDETSVTTDTYDMSVTGLDASTRQRYGHLFNFHSSDDIDLVNELPPTMGPLLDYVTVPSRFGGLNYHLPPDPTRYLPPFNVVSRYREPGKVNINTLFDRRVWDGLMDNYYDSIDPADKPAITNVYDRPQISFTEMDATRRDTAGSSPTAFDNPFRQWSDWYLRPTITPDPYTGLEPVDGTLLRRGTDAQPLLDVDYANSGGLPVRPYADPARNSFFRFDALRRLGSTVTTRSNVYSIWITIGRFEVGDDDELLVVNPGTVNERGVELGEQTGEIKRHRGYFMIDRSIPVGFEPGENHNVDKMILAETIIE